MPRVILIPSLQSPPSSVLNITKVASVMEDALQLPTDVITLDVAETTQASNVLCYETPETMCGHDLVTDIGYSLLFDNFLQLPETLDSMRNHNLLIYNFVLLPATPTSPVNIEKLKEELSGYPDPELANYLIQAFTYGSDIGCSGKRFPHGQRTCIQLSVMHLLSQRQSVKN